MTLPMSLAPNERLSWPTFAPGNGVQSGHEQSINHLGHGEPRQAGQMDHFRRRERMQTELGIKRIHSAEKIFVPLERQIRIVTSMQQQQDAAECEGLVDLL